jgi:hypothetical protein
MTLGALASIVSSHFERNEAQEVRSTSPAPAPARTRPAALPGRGGHAIWPPHGRAAAARRKGWWRTAARDAEGVR